MKENKTFNGINKKFKEFTKNKSERERVLLRNKIMSELGTKTVTTFYSQKNGRTELTISQGKVFAKHLECTLNDLFYEQAKEI